MSDNAEQRAINRQALTATTFVEIVDTLVDDFDVIDVLTQLTSRSVELLEVAAAGILLADEHGHLRVIGASTEQVQLLELFQIQNDEGPCLDCFHTGKVVLRADLGDPSPWPQFSAESLLAGYPSVCAVPLRLKDLILGCLNLFMSEPVGLSDAEIALAQALADVASIAIVQDQATRQAAIREGHLQHALISRISIEQAKGMIAERSNLDMDEAFARLRAFARNNNRGLTEVAEALVAGTLSIDAISPARPTAATTDIAVTADHCQARDHGVRLMHGRNRSLGAALLQTLVAPSRLEEPPCAHGTLVAIDGASSPSISTTHVHAQRLDRGYVPRGRDLWRARRRQPQPGHASLPGRSPTRRSSSRWPR